MSADPPRRVAVYFYGSFINKEVLQRVGYTPGPIEVARLWGFDIKFAPLATLVPSDRASVYGIVTDATHADLQRLYGEGWVAGYLPEAVLVETVRARWVPALTYIAWEPTPSAPFDHYLDHIIEPAKAYGFPTWYVEHVKSRYGDR